MNGTKNQVLITHFNFKEEIPLEISDGKKKQKTKIKLCLRFYKDIPLK